MFGADRRLLQHNGAFPGVIGLPAFPPGTSLADMGLPPGPAALLRPRPDGHMVDVQVSPMPDGGWVMTVTAAAPASTAECASRLEVLDSVVQHLPHGVVVFGPDDRATLVNHAYRAIMADSPIEVGDDRLSTIRKRTQRGEYGPGDPDALFASRQELEQEPTRAWRRTRPDGTVLDVRSAPLPDGGRVSVVTDVTPLTKAEASLKERAEVMDAMLANIRHGIVLWDRDQRIVAVNTVVDQLILAPPGLLVPGRTLEEVIRSAQDRGNLGVGQTALDTALRLRVQDRAKSHQDQRLTRTGRVLEVRTDPTPDGGFVTTYTDVTSIRQAEEALHIARRSAESANIAKSRFLAAMSHELRVPLSAVGALGEQIIRAPGTPAEVLAAAEASQAAARQLQAMIETILDVARLEAGRFDLSDDDVDLFRLVRTCVRQADASAAAAEVTLEVDLPDGLPAVRGDERRLRQSLQHLITNAVKFTGAGGTIRITAQHTPHQDLMLRVSDTGTGIGEADLDRVFEPFSTAETSLEGRFPGTGLGLYVSRALMRAHGGELLLRSRPQEGTTAVMRIPAERLNLSTSLTEETP